METHASRVSIYSVTSLYGAESLLMIGEQDGTKDADPGMPVRIRRIDWTRNLVESTLSDHPLFLLGKQPCVPGDDEFVRTEYLDWQSAMLANDKRHVVIVGGGHVGMEFLRLALSSSRFCAPGGQVPLSIRFDVFDNTRDQLHPEEPRAMRKFMAEAPHFTKGVLENNFDTHFHLMDVFDPSFAEELDTINNWHGGITYVFVALGDDLASVQAAIRVREVLERMRVRRNAIKQAGKRKGEYLRDLKPVVLAVVDDDDLVESLDKATDDGYEYQIEAVGSHEDMYTFGLIFGDDSQDGKVEESEYKRRSTRASDLHKKYKLFAYLRHVGDESVKALAVDWSKDFSSTGVIDPESDTGEAVSRYDAYVKCEKVDDHEWLLRMEHDRWNVYMWSEGFVRAKLDEVETFFDTCQTEERHRLNGANMHPCLVEFDELDELDERIDKLYDQAIEECGDDQARRDDLWRRKRDSDGEHKPFRLQDNDYLSFG